MARNPRRRSDTRHNSFAQLLTIGILVVVFALLAVAALYWANQNGLVFAPTPTPTGTPRPTASPTPDFRATRFVQDELTRTAYGGTPVTPSPIAVAQAPAATTPAANIVTATPLTVAVTVIVPDAPTSSVAEETTATPVQPLDVSPTPEAVATTPAGVESPEPTPSPTEFINQLPLVTGGQPSATPTVTWTPVPAPPTETWTPTPTATEPIPTPTEAPPTPTPTFTLTPVFTATPTQVVANSLEARVERSGGARTFLGPSTIYTETARLGENSTVELFGRTESGEWVLVCCLADSQGDTWVRQSDVRPTNNDLGNAIPEEADDNDVRWLRVSSLRPDLTPIPSPTPLPDEDYPLYRRTPDNQALVPVLPQNQLSQAWPAPYAATAGQPLTAPAVVAGNSIIIAAGDNHIHSVHREFGNQRWRLDLGARVRVAPAILDNRTFVATETGFLQALDDLGNRSQVLWSLSLTQPPVTGINITADRLIIGTDTDSAGLKRLLAFEILGEEAERLWQATIAANTLHYPVIGDQLVYVAGNTLTAYDLYGEHAEQIDGEANFVWRINGAGVMAVAPVYMQPGVEELAELYVADTSSQVFALDANTGDSIWTVATGVNITGLAVDRFRVFAVGNDSIVALSRTDGGELWRTTLAGQPISAPLVDNFRLLIFYENGSGQFLDAAGGSIIEAASIPASLAGPPIVSGNRLFVPATDGQLYSLQGSAP